MKTLIRADLAVATTVMLALTLTRASASADGGFVVLVNQGNSTTTMSGEALKRVLTGGTKQWGSGAAVQVGVIPGDVPETSHLASLVGMTTRELLSRISEQVFKGELRKPTVLHGPGDCAAFARAVPGAICVCAGGVAVPPESHVVAIQ